MAPTRISSRYISSRYTSILYAAVPLFISALLFAVLPLSPLAFGQLPATIHRVTPYDTALDPPSGIDELPPKEDGFPPAWRLGNAALILPVGHELNTRPITVSLWAKLPDANQYNILAAFEPKSSDAHWELFTDARTGELAVYLPKNPSGDHLRSGKVVTDDQWHFFELLLREDSLELYADAQKLGTLAIDRPKTDTSQAAEVDAKLSFGNLVEQSLPSPTVFGEVTITAGERISACVPQAPSAVGSAVNSAVDENTLLRLSLAADSAREVSGNTGAGNNTGASGSTGAGGNTGTDVSGEIPPTPLTLAAAAALFTPSPTGSFRIEGKLAAKLGDEITLNSLADQVEHLFPTGGEEREVPPGDHPAKNIPIAGIAPEDFDRRARELGITSISSARFRPGIFAFWGEQYVELQRQISGEIPLPRGAGSQVNDPETLIAEGEQVPAQVVARRAGDILAGLEENSAVKALRADLERLTAAIERDLADSATQNTAENAAKHTEKLTADFFLAAALRRRAMLLDPALEGLDRILFLARGCYAGCRLTNPHHNDRIGGHMATQVYGFNSIHGGGLFVLENWREKSPGVRNLLENIPVSPTEVCSRLSGRRLNYGSFYAPEVSYDGKTVYFSHTGSQEHRWIWTRDTTWNIFKLTLDDNFRADTLTQLTDSPYNDFDVCELPDSRLVFASERRGGFIRCFGEGADLRVTTAVLHSMKPDGTDLYPISFFETSEWQPSVDNNGMLLFTRWDYVDRENCLGSTFWTCAPDGSNPRSPQGNYPQPWFTFRDNREKAIDPIQHGDHRFGSCEDAPSGLPCTQMQFRAIPDSHKYIFTAAPHHGETYGSLCLLDPRAEDDHHMSQIRRLTPYTPFPETEGDDRGQFCYSSPWPLNEDLYLCNRWEDLILLDRWGNEELLCERELLPIGYDPRLRLTEPIPLAPRPKPPIIPRRTTQGEDYASADQRATIGVIDVRLADLPLPENRPIKYLRVIQDIPKPNPWMDTPWIGYATENTPRIPLGIVPVEEDGSVFFKAPAKKELIFQLLDADYRAVQTMRSAAFVHPGENLLCVGCHEMRDAAAENQARRGSALAFSREPSTLLPECGPVEPMNFYRRVQPILENSCVPCHTERNIAPTTSDHEALRPWVHYFSGGMRGETVLRGPHGGSRSYPGRVGSSESKLGTILFDENHLQTVSDDDRHALILWMDCNAPRLGAFRDEEAQKRGELIWPILDTEPVPDLPYDSRVPEEQQKTGGAEH